jgi:hypothetical protein
MRAAKKLHSLIHHDAKEINFASCPLVVYAVAESSGAENVGFVIEEAETLE